MTDQSIFFPKVVGLDVSLRAPGLCVLSGDPRGHVAAEHEPCRAGGRHAGPGALDADSALIRAGEDFRGPERLSIVTDALRSWLQSRSLLVAGRLYVIEGYAFSAHAAHSMGEIGGCVRKLVWESGGNLIIVPPSTLKKYLTGKGAGDKNLVMKHVFKRWGFDVDDDNQCDAFGCAMLGLVDSGSSENWTVLERDILGKKVERYAGKGQEAWLGGSAPGKVARRTRRRAAERVDIGSSVLSEDVQGPRRRRKHDPGRGSAPEDGVRGVE
jgi:Holliday junction resolvasome RuvABC endonuclease subunit